jgi:hypothetical protein
LLPDTSILRCSWNYPRKFVVARTCEVAEMSPLWSIHFPIGVKPSVAAEIVATCLISFSVVT